MKTVEHSESGWRILGELELPIGAEADGAISAWLTKILNPIDLHMDFLNKVTRSAQDAAVRAITAERAQTEFQHIHLCLFVPRTDLFTLYKGQTWGFFRIEKMGPSTENRSPHDHSIEFYLYLEG